MIGIGIDAGGTYTDGVIFDSDSGKILRKAKSVTTRHDFSIAIEKVMNSLCNGEEIELVSLSTTLATNAIVENKSGIAGLVLIGYDTKIVEDLITIKPYEMVSGRHNIDGIEIEPLDTDALLKIAESLRGRVDALAISSYMAARNPEHEIIARGILSKVLGVPIVCGHELSSELDSIKRATTAALNARLIPTIVDLITSVRKIMDKNGLSCPLMIVKGDGALMSEEMAVLRPVETILSGPAASIAGAQFLAGQENALVFDMGGTTSDIGIVKNNKTSVSTSGATVGEHRTCVPAVDVRTSGLGGDSYVQVTPLKDITVGPRRVVPLTYLASLSQDVAVELKRLKNYKKISSLVQPCDFFMYVKEAAYTDDFTDQERDIIKCLKQKPASRYQLCDALKYPYPSLLQTQRLEERGYIIRSSFTPTDALHNLGLSALWPKEPAVTAAEILGAQIGRSADEFCAMVKEAVERRLACEIVKAVLVDEKSEALADSGTLDNQISKIIKRSDEESIYDIGFRVKIPIVGIGAPVSSYLPSAVSSINSKLILLEHGDVANAVGAITGSVIERSYGTIRFTTEGLFVAHGPQERKEFNELNDAYRWLSGELESDAEYKARLAGARDIKIAVERFDSTGTLSEEYSNQVVFIESRIAAVATGIPCSVKEKIGS